VRAKQRQLEAILPASFAVTASRVAPESAEQRHDLRPEVDGPPGAEAADTYRHAHLGWAVPNDNLRSAIAGGTQVTMVINAHHGGVAARIARGAGNVPLAVGNDELPAIVSVRKGDLGWVDGKVRGRSLDAHSAGKAGEQTGQQAGGEGGGPHERGLVR